MLMSTNRPLVSILIITYNQATYVAEAISAALAQDYSPLEVVISDDRSNDATWRVILTAIANYHGPHIIKINRNEKNLGIARHVDTASRLAQGTFIVLAPGDDISYPDRVSRLVDAWQGSNPQPSLVFSNGHEIDSSGCAIGLILPSIQGRRFEKLENPFATTLRFFGATSGFDRRIYDEFPAVTGAIICEDAISFPRAHLLEGVLYIPDVLISYRKHPQGASQLPSGDIASYVTSYRLWRHEVRARIQQYRRDIFGRSNPNQQQLLDSVKRIERREQALVRILDGTVLQSTLTLGSQLLSKNNRSNTRKELLKIFLYRWIFDILLKAAPSSRRPKKP
jgi:glycosyltransferase involved in cell wall biosynthesis